MIDKVLFIKKDGSGTISMSEFKSQFGKKLPEDVWANMIKDVDENADGEVSNLLRSPSMSSKV